MTEDKQYKRMGDIVVGDTVVGENGQPVTVTQAYDEHIPKNMFKLTMANGDVVESSGNHLWYTENDEDRAERKTYFKEAKRFFKKYTLPAKDAMMPAYPMSLMPEKFVDNPKDTKSLDFIKRACESMGPSVATPDVTFDGYMDIVDEKLLYTFAFNDLIDFLNEMKKYIKDKKGYFYFGKVRTTEQIFSIIDTDINIPTKGEIINGN